MLYDDASENPLEGRVLPPELRDSESSCSGGGQFRVPFPYISDLDA
jgi:hypothetical protein